MGSSVARGRVGAWVVATALSACGDRHSRHDHPPITPPDEPSPARVAASGPGEGAVAVEIPDLAADDPSGPPGDLAADLASFTDLATCVARHRPTDPLLSDGLDALGYDRFVSDSCRSVEAVKRRDPLACHALMSSALARRCVWNVAVYAGDPGLCPLDEPAPRFWRHDPVCLAAASRDVRPCAALGRAERAGCEGLVAHDLTRCGTDGRCARLVGRWRTALPGARAVIPYRARATVTFDAGTDHAEILSLADEAAGGAVIDEIAGGYRLSFGEINPVALSVASPEATLGGFGVDLPAGVVDGGEVALGEPAARVSLRSPKGLWGLPLAASVNVRVGPLTRAVDARVAITLRATMTSAGARRDVTWEVDTWLRDYVPGAVGRPGGSASPAARAP